MGQQTKGEMMTGPKSGLSRAQRNFWSRLRVGSPNAASRRRKEDVMRKVILLATGLGLLFGAASAFAQQAPGGAKQPPAASGSGAKPAETQQSPPAQALVGLPIYSSDEQKVGQVNSVDVGPDGRLKSVQAEIEGFLGLGSSSVRITADQFKQDADRIVLSKTADQVRGLPGQSYKPWH
jgi:PRC-barrel domain